MIISASRVILGDRQLQPLEDAAILVQDGIIKEIDSCDKLAAANPAEQLVNYPDATLLPGLIDMHVHIGTDGAPDAGGFNDYMWALCAVSQLHQAFSMGVTTVRDVSSRDGLATTLREAVARGYAVLPRILTSNLGICMTGGHGYDTHETVLQCDGEWEIRKAIRRQYRDGADWVKILSSEGQRGQEYTQAELNAAVDECHRMGRLCAAHAGYQPSVAMCVKAGFDSIEHGTFLTVEEALQMNRHDQTWVPTIIAFAYIEEQINAGIPYAKTEELNNYFHLAVDAYAKNFKRLYETGVRVTCGTDQVVWQAPRYPVAQEAAYMVRYGISPLAAIETATKNGADALRLGDKLGQIKQGYIADILVTEGNPARDILDLQRVKAVYQSGELRYRSM